MEKDFNCSHCGREIVAEELIGTGTRHRNHCPFCLWSKHLDDKEAGDRKSVCEGDMRPSSLAFKDEGLDKWGKKKQGELSLVHVCEKCGKISLNRIAGDDDANAILEILKKSANYEEDEKEVRKQLFGV
jgi:DNA-directed RNA polymerase subunit RPC12/RpoP